MPSKIQHELIKLRGVVSTTGALYKDSIAHLKDSIDNISTDVKELQSKKDEVKSKRDKALSLAKRALKLASRQEFPVESHTHDKHENRHRQMMISNPPASTNAGYSGHGVLLDANVDEYAYYQLILPKDYISIYSINLIWYTIGATTTTTNWVGDITFSYGDYTFADPYDAINNYDTGNIIQVSSGTTDVLMYRTLDNALLENANYDANSDTPILIKVLRDANNANDTCSHDIIIRGILITYLADM